MQQRGRGRINSHLLADLREVMPAMAVSGETLAALSGMLCRNDGYLSHYVRQGVPIVLNAQITS